MNIHDFKPALTKPVEVLRRPRATKRTIESVAAASGDARIALGSGRRRLEGWINTDASWRAHCYLDAANKWPVTTGSVGLVYADNVIEHVSLHGARKLLREAHRALYPGGRIRLVTPDVRRNVEHYLAGFDQRKTLYDRHRAKGCLIEHPVDFLRIIFCDSGHWRGYLYDQDALAAELNAAGFTEVQRFEAGGSDTAAFRGIETRFSPAEQSMQLVLEAERA